MASFNINWLLFIKVSGLTGIALGVIPHLAFQDTSISYEELIGKGQPLLYGERVFITSGYGKGAALVDFTTRVPSAVWESGSYSCQLASLVKSGQFSYGIHGQAGGRSAQSKLFCFVQTAKNHSKRKLKRGPD